ncbi:tyrosine--tRNA ligase [Rubrivirga sp. SAORIC476]|uniref:tyrosine--tRNA ligase n=1 Tax=Rubrivirga sp. SAORIC476 TaxID=1961794 RepID=UPI000BA9938B|nr:tyrosine--tRNA ligase [Rubrivirga sp. SAORIC476]PAP74734.1 tyrosine--tRNA ligase [Rubrivirga sp. SAORIC476]
MTLLDDLKWRGVLYDQTPDLDDHLAEGSRIAYCGFDPTADSLHVGSLVPVMGLARLQRHGHTPVALVGGGTGLIGDPSGKKDERTLQTREQVDANVAGIRKQLERFLDFEGEHAAQMANNADWLTTIPLTDFLRDVGKHFTIGYMTAKESVKSRVESGLSFTEFSYMLLQAYDFLKLYEEQGATIQLGGSDQWGNITAGTELIRRAAGGKAHGFVMPLVTNASGTKFGKTEAGTIWLDAERTSPYRFYQFWFNADDRDVISYLKYFTWLERDEIEALEAEMEANPGRRGAQRALARAVTTLVHGEEATEAAERAGRALFGGDLDALDAKALAEVFEEAPSIELPADRFDGDGVAVIDLLVEAGLTASKGEARRTIQGGGVRVGDDRVEDIDRTVTRADAVDGAVMVLRKGKKSVALVRLI